MAFDHGTVPQPSDRNQNSEETEDRTSNEYYDPLVEHPDAFDLEALVDPENGFTVFPNAYLDLGHDLAPQSGDDLGSASTGLNPLSNTLPPGMTRMIVEDAGWTQSDDEVGCTKSFKNSLRVAFGQGGTHSSRKLDTGDVHNGMSFDLLTSMAATENLVFTRQTSWI